VKPVVVMAVEVWTIERYRDERLSDVASFVCSWNVDDRYDRFGNGSGACAEWLIGQLAANRGHAAFLACDGAACIGLLDYVVVSGEMHFGIFVKPERRRRGIGTALVRRLTALRSRSQCVVAQCRLENGAATALLRSCGFVCVSSSGGETEWMLRSE
jgi:ribosomal protein S18 acetylase RimI-like enzyme